MLEQLFQHRSNVGTEALCGVVLGAVGLLGSYAVRLLYGYSYIIAEYASDGSRGFVPVSAGVG